MQQINSANFGKRNGAKIDMVIIHYTEVSFTETVRLFQSPESEVSSHYLISEKGEVFQIVKDEDRAWHAGKSYWRGRHSLNDNSIGIEIVNNGKEEYCEVQINALIMLLRDLLRKYNIASKNVLGHSDIAPLRKDDPGIYFPWQRLSSEGLAYYPKDDLVYNQRDCKYRKEDIVKILHNVGYGINCDFSDDEVATVIYKFCLRFLQDRVGYIWNEYANSVALKIIKDFSRYSCY